MSQPQPTAVNILDREFLIACTPEERDALIASAAFLDTRLRDAKNQARGATLDRIAVLVALNLAHELLQLKSQANQVDSGLTDDLARLRMRIDGAIAQLGPRG
jgi:cell division protein ZapA